MKEWNPFSRGLVKGQSESTMQAQYLWGPPKPAMPANTKNSEMNEWMNAWIDKEVNELLNEWMT